MQYISKNVNQPEEWDHWFTTANGVRSFDYGADYENLPALALAKGFLL